MEVNDVEQASNQVEVVQPITIKQFVSPPQHLTTDNQMNLGLVSKTMLVKGTKTHQQFDGGIARFEIVDKE
jgi:hypothetical protein